jgi:TolB protein
VGKILLLADNDRRCGAEAYRRNADGSDVAFLTSLEFYSRAHAREAYSADCRYYTFVQSASSGQKQIFYRDALYGTEQSMTRFGVGNAWDPRWSPTADVVVLVANESRNDELWLVRKGEWPAVQLTQNEWAWDKHPSWSPDGTQIIFMSNRSSFGSWMPMAAASGN